MSHEIKVSHFFPIPVHELYGYFTDPGLLEKWSSPDGMTLKVPLYETHHGGRYRYEHTSAEGKYICNGHIRKIIPNELIRMVDDEIIDPKGKIVGKKIECDVKLAFLGAGSSVEITHRGFDTEAFAQECRHGWEQCFDNLEELVKDSGPHQFREDSPSYKIL